MFRQLIDVVAGSSDLCADTVQKFHDFGSIYQHLFGMLEHTDTHDVRTAYAKCFFEFKKLRPFRFAQPEFKASGTLFMGCGFSVSFFFSSWCLVVQGDGLDCLKDFNGNLWNDGIAVGFYAFGPPRRKGNSVQSFGKPIISDTKRGFTWPSRP